MLFHHYRFPDFLCLGARKSATSWVWKNLLAHPQICIPQKEMGFFNSDRPNKWYMDMFSKCEKNKIKGELTPDYIYFENLPNKIKKFNPKVKLFVILRNPSERAFSQWKFAKFMGFIDKNMSFIDMWNNDVVFVRTRGQYSEQLLRYMKFFKLGQQLEVYLYDDISICPKKFISNIYHYLGVDSTFVATINKERYYPTGSIEVPNEYIKFSNGLTLFKNDINTMLRYYDTWITETEKIIGRDLSHWRNVNI